MINIIEDNDKPDYFSPALPTHCVKVEPWGLRGTNERGGTDTTINPDPAVVTIDRHWWDYETGWGFEAKWKGRKVWFREHHISKIHSLATPILKTSCYNCSLEYDKVDMYHDCDDSYFCRLCRVRAAFLKAEATTS